MAWEELLSIFQQNAEEQAAEDATPPVACPNDGEVLQENAEGELRCPFDGWIWDGQPIRYR